MTGIVHLRDVIESDLPTFFEQQLDPDANYMAAFTSPRDPLDREAFMAHWEKILADRMNINKTILFEGRVAGNIVSFMMSGEREIGYWIGKEFWGKGIATQSLVDFLDLLEERPLYAHAAKDNAASLRVLEKCGFRRSGEGKEYSNARGEEVEEIILRLDY